ncbi:siphovirus Gp157 family protein [Pseudomonas helleri]
MEQKITYSVSKTKIKEAIKAGKVVSGAALITKQNLQIK